MLANQLKRANKWCAVRRRYSFPSDEGLTFEIWHFSTYFRLWTTASLVGKVWGWGSERRVIVQTNLKRKVKKKLASKVENKLWEKQTDKKAWNERHSEVYLISLSDSPSPVLNSHSVSKLETYTWVASPKWALPRYNTIWEKKKKR